MDNKSIISIRPRCLNGNQQIVGGKTPYMLDNLNVMYMDNMVWFLMG